MWYDVLYRCGMMCCTDVAWCVVQMWYDVLYRRGMMCCTVVVWCAVQMWHDVLYRCGMMCCTDVVLCDAQMWYNVLHRCGMMCCTDVVWCVVQLRYDVLYRSGMILSGFILIVVEFDLMRTSDVFYSFQNLLLCLSNKMPHNFSTHFRHLILVKWDRELTCGKIT